MSSWLLRAAPWALLFAVSAVHADEAQDEKVKSFLKSLRFQTGTVNVPKAHATLKLTDQFRYLDARDAQSVLEKLWGNPPDSDVLGLLVPANKSLAADDAWAVVITYSDDGHVSDEEAAKMDYSKVLKDMQEAVHDSNPERKKAGYPQIELVGWATPPRYDASASKLYWAKELKFDGSPTHTLNYAIRALGRGGYLSLNAVAGMDQLSLVQGEMQNVLAMTDFESGHKYTDFNPSTDKIAAYGIGALVAGTLAAKAGLFAKLFVFLLAAKKIIFIGLAAIGAFVVKIFKGKKDNLS